jgi:putative sigma-54 modulation protein
MKLTVTGRHVTVPDALRSDIARKLDRLERLLGDSAVSAQVILSLDGKSTVCEVTLHARGDHMLHGVGRHQRMASAVTAAIEKVAKQARRLKDRWKTRRRAGGKTVAPAPAEAPKASRSAAATAKAPRGAAAPRVIRARTRALKPMTVDDAILALADESRPFLVFRQAPSEAVAIIFTRPDGHYGLIEPEG